MWLTPGKRSYLELRHACYLRFSTSTITLDTKVIYFPSFQQSFFFIPLLLYGEFTRSSIVPQHIGLLVGAVSWLPHSTSQALLRSWRSSH